MKNRYFRSISILLLLYVCSSLSAAGQWSVPAGDLGRTPNVLIFLTDEHTVRAIGAHREQMDERVADLFGEGNVVPTPNLDRLASEGAIASKYYSVSPVCTPSRGTFVTGLYPEAHGTPKNDMQMNTDVITFGEYFKAKGYNTAYVGKWHLNEVTGANVNDYAIEPSFGFDDNTYMYHKAHPKWVEYLDRSKKGKDQEFAVVPYSQVPNQLPSPNQDLVYYTEFVANCGVRILEENKASGKPFCMVLSIPDPHTPDVCHANFYNKYKDMPFEAPLTHQMPEELKPKWATGTSKLDRREFDAEAKEDISQYYGMCDYIDEQVGRVLDYLDDNNLTDNTIVVFTADHGDMLFEHQRIDKGISLEASALIPFIIRYPGVIPEGKVVSTPQCNADFFPTLIGLVNGPVMSNIHGDDCSKMYTDDNEGTADRDVYLRFISGRMATLANQRYKLTLSNNERPFLYDLQKDPNELVNYYDDPSYEPIFTRMKNEMAVRAQRYDDSAYGGATRKDANNSRVAVASVALHNNKATMRAGERLDVYGLVNPLASASDKSVTWESSNPLVASVESSSPITGLVSALTSGTTTITVTTTDGNKVASYELTVSGSAPSSVPVIFEDKKAVVSPSVFNESINVTLQNGHEYSKLVLYDVLGNICYTQAIGAENHLTLMAGEIGAKCPGIYLVKLIGKDKILSQRLVKRSY